MRQSTLRWKDAERPADAFPRSPASLILVPTLRVGTRKRSNWRGESCAGPATPFVPQGVPPNRDPAPSDAVSRTTDYLYSKT